MLDPACVFEIEGASDSDVEVDREEILLLSLGLPESSFCLFFL